MARPKKIKENDKIENDTIEILGKPVTLVLARNHSLKAFRLGKHIVTNMPQEFILSEEEIAELKTNGPKAWIKEVKPAIGHIED